MKACCYENRSKTSLQAYGYWIKEMQTQIFFSVEIYVLTRVFKETKNVCDAFSNFWQSAMFIDMSIPAVGFHACRPPRNKEISPYLRLTFVTFPSESWSFSPDLCRFPWAKDRKEGPRYQITNSNRRLARIWIIFNKNENLHVWLDSPKCSKWVLTNQNTWENKNGALIVPPQYQTKPVGG